MFFRVFFVFQGGRLLGGFCGFSFRILCIHSSSLFGFCAFLLGLRGFCGFGFSHPLEKQNQLKQNQDANLSPIYPYVNDEIIVGILSGWTKIPISIKKNQEEIVELMCLDRTIKQSVFGQDHAIEKNVQHIQIYKTYVSDDRKPIGVFLLVGASGVGTTDSSSGFVAFGGFLALAFRILCFPSCFFGQRFNCTPISGAD